MNTRSVGTGVPRVGGRERVNGSQQFLADIRVENMLYVKLVTLDVACARIDSIDTSNAVNLPGVACIVTPADLPRPMPRFGPVYQDRPVLADGVTTYHGEPVCAVAAESRDMAEAAAEAVRIGYTELPGVFTVEAALARDAPLVQSPHLRPDDPLARSNVLRERRFEWGTIDETDVTVVDHTYAFPMVTHFAIEPHGAIAHADADGLTIWSPVQNPYLLQRMISDLFEQPLARVRVLAPDPGGAFGGKQNPKFEPLLAWMALKTGRPCRLVLTLEETFQAVRRTSCSLRVRSGFRASGELVFHEVEADFLLGAYADIAERVVAKAGYLACGPYRTPNARILARAILSNTTPSCAFRGFGTPQVAWAIESQMDAAARLLRLDGLEIRRMNLARFGEEVVPGDVPADGEWRQSLERAAEMIGWDRPPAEGRGRGIAVAIKAGATTGLSQATVRLLFDGSVIVYAGTSDMGQGARTIFAQIAADEFGVTVDDVSVVSGDTALVPFDLQTSASRSTVFMGNAILAACEDVHRQLRSLAATVHDVDAADVEIRDGRVHVKGEPHAIASLLERGLGRLRGELVGNGTMRREDGPDHPLGGAPAFYEFNCTAFEVSVDRETGEVLIHRHVTVGDVGKALNPLQVTMQDEGAAIMGLGHSLMEQLLLDDRGRIRNLGALDYRIPTTRDVPLELESEVVENGDGPGPRGSKGVSEGAILCTAPALAAAVADATGVVIRDLPLTPERVWSALHTQREEERNACPR